MELLLIRHGLTRANLEHRFCGRTDWPLIPEAFSALRLLKDSEDCRSVERVAHTGLLRTQQTAAFLFPDKLQQKAPDLSEFNFGNFEGLNHQELLSDPEYIHWLEHFETAPCPQGESQTEFLERVGNGWQILSDEWCREGIEKAALVTHGGVISALMSDWFPNVRPRLDWQPACGAGYLVSFCLTAPVSFRRCDAKTV